jgi:hypothetical protein
MQNLPVGGTAPGAVPADNLPTAPSQVAEPPQVVELGVTTSEWAIMVRYLWQLLAAGTATGAAYLISLLGYHFQIPPDVLTAIVGLEVSGALAVSSYALSRGIRKHGA